MKILQVYVNKETSNNQERQFEQSLVIGKSRASKKEESMECDFNDKQLFSLRDIINYNETLFTHKVFKIVYKGR